MKKSFHIVHGPNLNLIGQREPNLYGRQSFTDFLQGLQNDYALHNIHYFQSNHEGALIDHLHKIGFNSDGIILNAGAYSHTSLALADAVAALTSSVVEVHISNIYARESYRRQSYLSAHVKGVIVGFGLYGYRLALEALLH